LIKADISVPHPIFEVAEELAQRFGMSRSEFYTAALAAYIKTYEQSDITETLNQLYKIEPSTLEPILIKIQALSMTDGESW
jgi:metal-responsive CopG/Arc/MetJ family transcriptional regulator